jgi:hypothetical protein
LSKRGGDRHNTVLAVIMFGSNLIVEVQSKSCWIKGSVSFCVLTRSIFETG